MIWGRKLGKMGCVSLSKMFEGCDLGPSCASAGLKWVLIVLIGSDSDKRVGL